MSEKEKLIEIRDTLREAADIIDKVLLEGDDEEIQEELLGSFMVKMLRLQSLGEG